MAQRQVAHQIKCLVGLFIHVIAMLHAFRWSKNCEKLDGPCMQHCTALEFELSTPRPHGTMKLNKIA